jgi:hypothetical protein
MLAAIRLEEEEYRRSLKEPGWFFEMVNPAEKQAWTDQVHTRTKKIVR